MTKAPLLLLLLLWRRGCEAAAVAVVAAVPTAPHRQRRRRRPARATWAAAMPLAAARPGGRRPARGRCCCWARSAPAAASSLPSLRRAEGGPPLSSRARAAGGREGHQPRMERLFSAVELGARRWYNARPRGRIGLDEGVRVRGVVTGVLADVAPRPSELLLLLPSLPSSSTHLFPRFRAALPLARIRRGATSRLQV